MSGGGGGREGRDRPGGRARPPATGGPRRPGGSRTRDAGPRARGGGPGPAGFRGGGPAPDPAALRRARGARQRRAQAPHPGGAVPPGARGAGRRGGLRRGNPARRLRVGLLCVAFALSLVAGRLVQLQGLEGARYRKIAEQQRVRTVSVPAERGRITTAGGTILAMTVPFDTVYADPPQITGKTRSATRRLRRHVATLLAGPLHMPSPAVLNLLDHPTSKDYVVLAKGVPATTGTHIAALMNASNVAGIYLTPTYARAYPNGDLASNLTGFTTTDARGDLVGGAGIEEAENSLLAGRDGRELVETGTNGQPIPGSVDRIKSMVPGGNVRLTIVASLQYEAQRACAERVAQVHAAGCTVVVMQPSTGKILALAQAPGYNPADVGKLPNLSPTVDSPVALPFPPGSTAKVIGVSAALEHGGKTPMSTYTVPYQITVPGAGGRIFTFHDADIHPTERLTIAGILAHSSNVGMVQVVQSVSPQLLYRYYKAFGIGEPTGLHLPGASPGLLAPPSKWWPDQRYTLAFGQGVSVNTVQMASVYATIANGGIRVTPSVVAGTTGAGGRYTPARPPQRHRVIKASTAHELIRVLQQVPWLDATIAHQPWGEIPGYSVAAKTGTAQEGTCQCQYGSSYVGMAPATNPQLVVAVNVQHPQPKYGYYGNAIAGPVFYHVMKFALQTMKIPPDHGKRPNVRLSVP